MLGKAHNAKGEKKAALRCFREALKLDAYYNEVWFDLGVMILKEGYLDKALPYLEKAYKVIGDIPGINFLLASYYLHSGFPEKGFRHLSLALDVDKELYKDFEAIFPANILNRKIKKLLDSYNLTPED